MKKIEGPPKNLKQLLQNTKDSIHYYQREYMWQRKHIEELIDDLTSEFLEYYKTDDPRQAVADYGAYFMGSIVLAGRENAIIDGQQRFSSLTLDQLITYIPNPKDRTKKKTEYLLQFENEAMHMFQAILGISEYLYRLRELELMYDGKIPIMVQERVKWPKKIGRNELCPCGSGKKYKRCHGR